MAEVANKDIDQTIVVEVPEGAADRVPPGAKVPIAIDLSRCTDFREAGRPVVEPKLVGLQTIVRNINVEVTIEIEVGRGYATGALLCRGLPMLLECRTAFVEIKKVGIVPRGVPDFVAGIIDIDIAVVIEVPQTAPRETCSPRSGTRLVTFSNPSPPTFTQSELEFLDLERRVPTSVVPYFCKIVAFGNISLHLFNVTFGITSVP